MTLTLDPNGGYSQTTSKMVFWRRVKNNNGNHSLRLVPIHYFQPRLSTMSDYCYSDRLHLLIRDLFLQPLAFRYNLLRYNLSAVFSSVLRRTSRTKFLNLCDRGHFDSGFGSPDARTRGPDRSGLCLN